MKIRNILLTTLVTIVSLVVLVLTIRGTIGNPIYYQTEKDTKVGGPFEASNSTARYALVEAIVENRSLFLSESQAKFASPDVVEYKGKYLSIFTPGVSFIAVPFYVLGAAAGFPQLITYLSVAVFGLLNVFLVARLARKLGANFPMSMLSGLTFLFATNAFVYAQSLTQHHMGTAVILLGILNALVPRTVIRNVVLGALFVIGALIDVPNAMIMIPLLIYILFRHIDVKKDMSRYKIVFNGIVMTIAIGALPLIGIFAWYNHATTGSYTTLAQSIGRSSIFNKSSPSEAEETKEVSPPQEQSLPFDSRNELSSLYTLLISNERAWIFYSPVVLLGVIGAVLLYRQKKTRTAASLLLAVVLTNIAIYSMFGDPWGGWSFGPRYLIPSAAVLCASLGFLLAKYRHNYFMLAIFFVLFTYSAWVNTLGVITTSSIPPRVEAINLPQPIPYTYEYNLQLLSTGQVSSLFYNLYGIHYLTPGIYQVVLMITIGLTGVLLYGFGYLSKEDHT